MWLGSSNLRGDIVSITPFIRGTRRMERRAVEVTVGESTLVSSTDQPESAAWFRGRTEILLAADLGGCPYS